MCSEPSTSPAAPSLIFSPGLKKRCDGITTFRTLLGPFQGKIRIFRYELFDPKVQVQGDIAVLTYNLLDYEKSGSKIGRWNTTEVYMKSRGVWRLFSSHFSYTKKDAEWHPGIIMELR